MGWVSCTVPRQDIFSGFVQWLFPPRFPRREEWLFRRKHRGGNMGRNGLVGKSLACLLLALCVQGVLSGDNWKAENCVSLTLRPVGTMRLDPCPSTSSVTNQGNGDCVVSGIRAPGESPCATLSFDAPFLQKVNFRVTRMKRAFLSRTGLRLPYALRLSVHQGTAVRNDIFSRKDGPYAMEFSLSRGERVTFSVILDPADYGAAACGGYSEEIKVEMLGR